MGSAESRPRNWLSRFTTFWWSDKGLSVLLVLILLAFMLSPLVRPGLSSIIVSIFFSLLLLSGTLAITEKKLLRAGVALVVLICIILTWLKIFYPGNRQLYEWSDLTSLVFLILLTQVVIRHVYQEGPVTTDRIRGAIAAYILIGFTWAILYHFIELSLPGSFRLTVTGSGGHYYEKQSDLTYYSFMTMTTVGYGDVIPVHPIARAFAVLEALIGQLYPATLLARLVSLQITHPAAGKEKMK